MVNFVREKTSMADPRNGMALGTWGRFHSALGDTGLRFLVICWDRPCTKGKGTGPAAR